MKTFHGRLKKFTKICTKSTGIDTNAKMYQYQTVSDSPVDDWYISILMQKGIDMPQFWNVWNQLVSIPL